ncbi:MAG: hypothetical protein GY803_04985, partial [Chloroflexi bacterium]|nr:hypothetical protein [Chloroflexota bacterium]
MNDLMAALVLAIGLAAGVLLTLLIDGRILGERLETAAAQNRKLQQKTTATASRLAAAQSQISGLTQDLDKTTRQIEALTAQTQSQQQEIAAATAEKETVYAQFHELRAQLDKLRDEHQLACRRLAITAVELKYMRRDLDKAEDQSQRLIQLQTDKQLLEAKANDLHARLDAAQLQLNAVGLKGKKQVEIVRGIGPAYARRLHEAGIHDLTHLAAQTAARV